VHHRFNFGHRHQVGVALHGVFEHGGGHRKVEGLLVGGVGFEAVQRPATKASPPPIRSMMGTMGCTRVVRCPCPFQSMPISVLCEALTDSRLVFTIFAPAGRLP
jgi:hypothetical protein